MSSYVNPDTGDIYDVVDYQPPQRTPLGKKIGFIGIGIPQPKRQANSQ